MENQSNATQASSSKITAQEPRGLESFSGLIPDTRNEVLNCPKHGRYESMTLVFSDGKKKQQACAECSHEDSIRSDEQRKIRLDREGQRNAEQKIKLLLGRSGIPARFEGKSFSDYVATSDEQAHHLQVCAKYASEFPMHLTTGSSLIFCGLTGTGKTHLACAIANQIIREHSKSAIYVTIARAIRKVKDTFGKRDVSEGEVIASFSSPDLLILDEVGVQYGSDAERNILFEIINERYERMKPTILMSNLSLEELRQFTGDRVLDRLKEGGGGGVLVFDWQSHRGLNNHKGERA